MKQFMLGTFQALLTVAWRDKLITTEETFGVFVVRALTLFLTNIKIRNSPICSRQKTEETFEWYLDNLDRHSHNEDQHWQPVWESKEGSGNACPDVSRDVSRVVELNLLWNNHREGTTSYANTARRDD
jgi:hypothetical protein